MGNSEKLTTQNMHNNMEMSYKTNDEVAGIREAIINMQI